MKHNYPLTREQTLELIARHPTPFHLYDEQMIRDNASRLLKEPFLPKALLLNRSE